MRSYNNPFRDVDFTGHEVTVQGPNDDPWDAVQLFLWESYSRLQDQLEAIS